jgi:ankyrin repeat protein
MSKLVLSLIGVFMLAGFGQGGVALADGTTEFDQQLIVAAEKGDLKEVTRLLGKGAHVNAVDGNGNTALMKATHGNFVDVARVLIDKGADVNAQNDILDSPYLYAGAEGLTEILKMTLKHGADLKGTNRFGGTALIPAAEKGHPENVRLLIEAGVDVDHINKLGWTALLEAIILTDGGPVHQEIVKLLIDGGADVNIADFDGVTPLQHAQRMGYTIIAQLLIDAGAREL